EELVVMGRWPVCSNEDGPCLAAGQLSLDVLTKGAPETIVIEQLAQSPYANTDERVNLFHLQTYVGHAVRCEDEPVGALSVIYQQAFTPTQEDLELVGIFASALRVEEERRAANEIIKYQAYHDALTELPNRRLFT